MGMVSSAEGWVCQQAGGYGLEVGCASVPYHTPQKVRTQGAAPAEEIAPKCSKCPSRRRPSPPVATAPPTSVALDGSASPASPSLFSPSLASPLVLGAALPAPSVTSSPASTSLPLQGEERLGVRVAAVLDRIHTSRPPEPSSRHVMVAGHHPCSPRISTCVPISTTACPAILAASRPRAAAPPRLTHAAAPSPSPRDLQWLKVRQVRYRAPLAARYITKCACGRTLTEHITKDMGFRPFRIPRRSLSRPNPHWAT